MWRRLDSVAIWSLRGVLFAIVGYFAVAALLRFAFYPPMAGHEDLAHAGGLAGGVRYTNSLAAMEESRDMGFRIYEIDFVETSDGVVVCGHDWDDFGGIAPDFDTFLEWRRGLEFEPCTVPELLAWLDRHEEAILYSDVKMDTTDAQALLHAHLGGRLIADATTPEMVCELSAMGIGSIVYSTYRRPNSLAQLRQDLAHPCLAENEVLAVAISVRWMLVGHGFVVRAMTGLPVYTYTIDNCALAYWMRLLGADALFSEALRPGAC